MSLRINNVTLNTNEILALIANDSKIQAIKYIKERADIGLKECKEIVDNLTDNPNFYEGKSDTTEIPDLRFSKESSAKKPFRGSHIKKSRNPQFKSYLIVFLLFCIFFLLYLFWKE